MRDEISYEMDDLEAEAYFSENPHVNQDVDVVTLAPMPCDMCDQQYYEFADARLHETMIAFELST